MVEGALPGERLEVEITKSLPDYDEAKVVKVLEPSPHRAAPACPLCGKCGGCDFMFIESDFQTELKKKVLADLAERAGLEIPQIQVLAGEPFGYRSRFQLHDGGLEERKSNNVVPIENCPVAVPQINEWLKATPMEERPKGRGLLFAWKSAEPELSFALDSPRAPSNEGKPQNSGKNKGKKRGNKKPPSRFEGIAQDAQCPVQIELCGKKILFDARGFFQSNIALLEKAVPLIMEGLAGKNALDLYSGAGTFSAFLADKFENVVMVEQNRLSLVYAERNLAGRPHESYGISGADFAKRNARLLSERLGGFDALVVDPPRSGIEREALDWICESGIPAIKYLSCNPSTQVRDLKRLSEAGYKIEEFWLLDFYPQTSHLESFSTCIKK